MLRIAICDDEKVIIEQLHKIITEILQKNKCDSQITIFLNGEGILEKAEELDVVFMDIEMPDKDGLQLGQELKERNPKCKIIMATGIMERFKEAFYIKAHRFITKPFDKEEIEEALLSVIEECKEESSIKVYYQRNAHNILQKDIQYIEAYGGYYEFEVEGTRFRKVISLSELESILDSNLFVRIDRRYIVNMQHIEQYKEERFMIGKKQFSISRRRQKDFERKYIEFDLYHRRR